MKTFLVLIVLAIAVNYASAACMQRDSSIVFHKYSHKISVYCEYRGMKFMKGSKWIDFDRCQKCSCINGLECCGFGYFGGAISVPGCVAVRDQCDRVLLNKAKTGMCKKV